MAIQYLGTTISGIASDDKPTLTANEKGVLFVETDTNKIYQWDTDSWNELITSTNTSVGALNSGSITSGFGTIDTGSSSITTTGTITAGTLTVSGTTNTINSTNTTIADRLIELASGATASTADAGIIIERGSTGDNAIMAWDESADRFIFGTTTATGSSTGDLTIAAGTIQAAVIGNVTGDVTGTADTATVATTVTLAGSGNVTYYPTFVDATSGNEAIRVDSDWTYNASTDKMTVTNIGIPDSGKIEFGTSQDLQIYHDTNNSIIHDNGAGNLLIGTSGGEVQITTGIGSEWLARFIKDDGVYLYDDGSVLRFNTSTTGATVTGAFTATGPTTASSTNVGYFSGTINNNTYLLVENLHTSASGSHAVVLAKQAQANGGDPKLMVQAPGITWALGADNSDGDVFKISGHANLETNTRLTIDGNGAASFTGMVTIGQSTTTGFATGADNLIVGDGSNHEGMTIYTGNDKIGSISFADAADPDGYSGYIQYGHGTQGENMTFGTAGSPAVTIDSTQTFHTTLLGPRSGDYMYLRTDGNGTKANIRLSDSDSEVQFNNSSNGGILTLGTYINSNARKNLSMRSKYVSSQYKVQVGLNNDDPFQNVAGGTSDLDVSGLHIKDTVAHGQLVLEANPPSLHMMDSAGGTDDKWMMYRVDGGLGWFQSLTDGGSDRVDNILVMDMGTGNVGIGTDSPTTHKLHVTGTNNGELALLRLDNTNTGSSAYAEMDMYSSTANLRIGITDPSYSGFTGAAFIRNQTDGQIRLGTGSNNIVLNIDNNGRVGIGETTPAGELHVKGSQMSGIVAEDTHASGNPRILLKAASGRVGYIRQQTAGANGVQTNWYATNDANSRAFSIAASGGFGDSAALMMVMANGNTGIGTHAPDQKLEVTGAIHLSGEVSTPSAPADGDGAILYTKADGKLYFISNEASETEVGGGGGGGAGVAIAMALVFGSTYS